MLIDFLLNDDEAIKTIKLENGYPESTHAKELIEELGLTIPIVEEAHQVGLETVDPKLATVYKWQRARTDDANLDVITKLDYGEIDVDEAAKMDGCNSSMTLTKVLIPILKPSLITAGTLSVYLDLYRLSRSVDLSFFGQ